jgi:hypothetical protein
MELENIMLSEVIQAQKVNGDMFSSYVETRLISYVYAHTHIYIYM